MEKLYLKDRKILYHLDIDSRQSFRSIGRKVGLSKDVVTSRVKKLQEKGIINKFYTRIDPSRFGFTTMRVYFKFQYTTPDIKNEIITYLKNCKSVFVLISIEGNYDLNAAFCFKEIHDINDFWMQTLNKYGDFFSKRIISIFSGETDYPKSFLINELADRKKLKTTVGTAKKIEIDPLDHRIICLLTLNARMPIKDIASQLKTSMNVISYRIKKLIDLGVIIGFKVLIDIGKLGYNWYKADLFLKDFSNKQKIINYLEEKQNLVVIDTTIGYADLEFEFCLENTDNLLKIYEEVSTKFPNTIKDFSYFRVLKVHKFFGLNDILK